MTQPYTDADVEYIVTLLRQTDGHRDYHEAAADVLSWMAANGVKMTTRTSGDWPIDDPDPDDMVANDDWRNNHDAAPMTPGKP